MAKMKKICSICEEEKSLEDFSKMKHIKSGYGPYCKPCDNKRKIAHEKAKREQNPEAYLERRRKYVRTYKEKHPERIAEQDRRIKLRNNFGITTEQYDELLVLQGGVCACCGAEPNSKRLAVDHDHNCCPGKKTCGECIRGLLCSNCNTALGLLKEDKNTIKKLLEYINSD